MKEMTTCIVCGKKYIKSKRKDASDCCSKPCYLKYKRRSEEGLPISDEEFNKGKAERRKEATIKRTQNQGFGYLARGDVNACRCKKKDCLYIAQTSLPTCDYFLKTGTRRGCPVESCDKYISRKTRKELQKNF